MCFTLHSFYRLPSQETMVPCPLPVKEIAIYYDRWEGEGSLCSLQDTDRDFPSFPIDTDNPREELWGGGLSRERPPYSERSLPRGRPHRNQGHGICPTCASCPGFAPPFPFWLMGLFPACRASAPRALMGRIQCVPIPAARSDIPVHHGRVPREGSSSAQQVNRRGIVRQGRCP